MDKSHIKVVGILTKNAVYKLSNIFKKINAQNELVLFCMYSEFDIPTGHIFNEIISTDTTTDNYKSRIKLKKVSQEFGIEYDQIPKGHKTICQFEFLDGSIPDIIYQLPTIDGWFQSDKSLIFK